MDDRDPWLEKLDELEHRLRRFFEEARAHDRPAPVDALADVLDAIRDGLLEDVHAASRQVVGRARRGEVASPDGGLIPGALDDELLEGLISVGDGQALGQGTRRAAIGSMLLRSPSLIRPRR